MRACARVLPFNYSYNRERVCSVYKYTMCLYICLFFFTKLREVCMYDCMYVCVHVYVCVCMCMLCMSHAGAGVGLGWDFRG